MEELQGQKCGKKTIVDLSKAAVVGRNWPLDLDLSLRLVVLRCYSLACVYCSPFHSHPPFLKLRKKDYTSPTTMAFLKLRKYYAYNNGVEGLLSCNIQLGHTVQFRVCASCYFTAR